MSKVSLIIATHSRPDLLPRAIESAFASGTDVEVIVVDDASVDETAHVCKLFERIKYVRVDRNQLTAGARNIGILNSTAPYIGFLDDDDWKLPGVLDEQIQILDEKPEVGLVYAPYLLADQAGRIIEGSKVPTICPQGDIFWDVMYSNPIGCLTSIFRKSCISRIGLLDSSIPGLDDLDLWIRIAELYELAAVAKPAAVWRKPTIESKQGSSDMSRLLLEIAKTFERKWSKLPRAINEKEKLEEVREKFTDSIMKQMFYEAIRSENLIEGLKKFYQALTIHPKYFYRPYTHKAMLQMLVYKTILPKA